MTLWHGQEREHALPGSIIAVVTGSVNGICPFEQTANLGAAVPVSAGIALTGTAGITQISALLALVLEQQEQAVFQRLREWYLNAKQKSGKKRRELDVTTCFAPLLRWIVRLWGNGNRQMVLVLDATTLGEQWTILSISVVIRSCAIPVAWKVLGGHEKGSWQPHWKGLLKHLDGCIPTEWQVLVMTDRGLYARWLGHRDPGVRVASVFAHQSGGQGTRGGRKDL
jgi:hypothetical protein